MTSRALSFVPFVTLFAAGCQLVYGDGEAAFEDRTDGAFDAVASIGSLQVDVVIDGSTEVVAECDRNLLEYIDTRVADGVLYVTIEDEVSIQPRTRCRLVAHTASLEELSAEGSGSIHVEGVPIALETVNLTGSGSIDVDAPIEVAAIEVDAYGSGDVTLASVTGGSMTILHEGSGGAMVRGGAVDDLLVDSHGSGDTETADLEARRATVDLTGSGSVHVFASERAEVRLEGSGSVFVHGAPDSRDERIEGSGEIFYE